MKTAMQELLEWHRKSIRSYSETNKIIEAFIEKEKEQLEYSWDAGISEGIGTTMASLDYDGEFINYYNETYNNDINNNRSN